MSKNLMVIFASATLALVGCSDKDSADDSGASDGADGGSDGAGDGADGTAGAPVAGAAEAYFADQSLIGTWDVAGETVACSGCTFAFDGEFTASGGDFADDFERVVEIDTNGYVYTDGGEYWGYGDAGNGYAYWYTADSSTSGYYYFGYVSY